MPKASGDLRAGLESVAASRSPHRLETASASPAGRARRVEDRVPSSALVAGYDAAGLTHRHSNLRLFVAVYPPPEITRVLLDALRGFDLPPHRRVKLEQVHLTLHFIGDVPKKQIDATIETVQRATIGVPSFLIASRRLISLPARGPARLVAAETDSPPPLIEMQRRLVMRLAHGPRRNPGDRFRPHLTLCRLKAPTAIPAIDQSISVQPFAVCRIALMQSTLAPDGAQHHEVASFPLGLE